MKALVVSKACIVAAYRVKLEEMARLGVDLTLVVPPYWEQNGKRNPLELGRTDGYRMVVLPAAFNGHFHLHFYPRLRDVIGDVRPDLVHLDEEPYDTVTFHGTRLARRAGAAIVFFTWQNLRRRLPPPFTVFQQYVFAQAAGALAGNREAETILRDRGWTGPTEVLPQFGVDEEAFCPAESPPAANRPFTIGYAGRLVPEKGLPDLLEAAAGLHGDWRLVVLGDGPERASLDERAGSLGITSRTEFRSGIPSTSMPEFYRGLDVLVLPSHTRPNWKEQFGRVLVEAMACGVTPVGSDSGEIPHVIADAGLVFPEGDTGALRRNLRTLFEDQVLRRTLAERGRSRVLRHYTQRHIAEQTVAFYQRLLERRG